MFAVRLGGLMSGARFTAGTKSAGAGPSPTACTSSGTRASPSGRGRAAPGAASTFGVPGIVAPGGRNVRGLGLRSIRGAASHSQGQEGSDHRETEAAHATGKHPA